MSGGLQVQAAETYKALKELGGIDVSLFNWSENSQVADLYHFIGFPPYIARVMELVKSAGRPYVITMLFGCETNKLTLCLALARRWMKSEILRLRARQDAILNASALITITQADARALNLIHRIEWSKIYIVPNGVHSSFFNAKPDIWHKNFGKEPFILSVGAIQPRKNQLLLLQAANRLRLPVVLIGTELPGWEEYAIKVEKEHKINAAFGGRWIKNLTNENPLLPSAYAACSLFVLLSSNETQPLSVLQAMASRRPVLLLNASYTDEPPFDKLQVTNGQNIEAVAADIKKNWDNGVVVPLPEEYNWHNVALKLKSIYEAALADYEKNKKQQVKSN
ncbi:MAG: glycosyltransferase family 4 protein [Verrucomicrobiia bacterium]